MSIPVTCVIPVHNGAATIERAIESAFAAGCDRVHVCNDASTDDTHRIINEIYKRRANRDLTFCIFHNITRCGAAITRNRMIETPLVTNDGFVIPLDCDDTLRDIKSLKTACGENSWAYGDYIETDGKYETKIAGAASVALTRKNITGVTFMFRKSDWEKVRGYDPDFAFAEDYAFQCALTNAGVQPVYVNQIIYDRYIKPEGNERTVLAGQYWDFYHKMAQRKYSNLFTVNR